MNATKLFATAALALAGCATLTPVHPIASASGAAQIVLEHRERDLFRLEVFNTSPEPIVVQRDAIKMERPSGVEYRMPGGLASTYYIPPGGSHAVNVRFDLSGLESGDPVRIDFNEAIFIGGQAVPVDPIELRVN